jgi:hypothetical protein
MNLARAITGMMLPRREITPSTPTGMLGVLVTAGVWHTSRTLNTLMPNISPVPRENSRISILLEPASLDLASTESNSWLFCAFIAASFLSVQSSGLVSPTGG